MLCSLALSACATAPAEATTCPKDEAVAAVDPAAAPVNHEPEDEAFAAPEGMRRYALVLLRRGPKWTAEDSPETRELGAGHMAYIQAQAKAGKLRIAGPFLGQTDAEDIAGIYIYDVRTVAEAKALVAQDPAVAAGRFVPEFLVWMAGDGIRTTEVWAPPVPEGKSGPCEDAAFRQFDFWRGQWVVESKDGQFAGFNEIEVAHGGCALIEHWRSANGGSGTSTNQYLPATGKWVQHWVDASGSSIDLEGGLVDGSMVLEGSYRTPDGKSQRMRGTWTQLEDGRVRQFFETSPKGKTWTPWFEGFYRRVEVPMPAARP